MPKWGPSVMDHVGYHSMPGTPLAFDPRLPEKLIETLERSRIDPDYFSGHGLTGLDFRPRTPYVLPHERHEHNMFRHRPGAELREFVAR